MAKREIDVHEVTIHFTAQADDVERAVRGDGTIERWLRERFGFGTAFSLAPFAFNSAERRFAVARLARKAVLMSGLRCGDFVVLVDGAAVIDDEGGMV